GMKFHGHVVHAFPLELREQHFRILGHPQGFGIDSLPIDDERDGIRSSEYPRSSVRSAGPPAKSSCWARGGSAAAACTERTLFLTLSSTSALALSALAAPAAVRSRRCHSRLDAQVPAGGLEPRLAAVRTQGSRNLASFPAGRIGDLQLDLADLLLVEPRDDCRLRRVLAEERLIAPELVVAIPRRPAEHRRGRRCEQLRIGRRRLHGCILLNRLQGIQDPQRSTRPGPRPPLVPPRPPNPPH